MYTYTAGATGLDAMMPPWVQEGGFDKWRERLQDPALHDQLVREISTPTEAWENLYLLAGSADRVLLTGFRNDALKPLTGKTLAEVARMRPDVVYCGDEAAAKATAAQLARDAGFNPVDAGALRVARYLEPFGVLIAELAYEQELGETLGYRIVLPGGS